MNFKTTYILFGLLGAMLVVLGIVLWVGPSAPDSDYLLPSAHDKSKGEVKSDDVARVEIERRDEPTIVLTRELDDKTPWQLEEPIKGRVDTFAVDRLVEQVLTAKRESKADLSGNVKEYGLDEPQAVVTLHGKGRTFTLKLGDSSPGGHATAVVYASSSETEGPVAVLKREVDHALYDLSQIRSRDLLGTGGDSDVKYVSLAQGGKAPVVLEAKGATDWRFVKPDYGPADSEGAAEAGPDKALSGVRPLVSALTSIRVEAPTPPAGDDKKKDEKKEEKKPTGFVEDNAGDLKKYGLESEKDAELVLTVANDARGKDATTLLVGKKLEKTDSHYARLADSKNVVTVSGKSLEPVRKFLANPQELRDHNLVRLTGAPDVVRVKYPSGEEIELIKTAAPPAHGGFPMPDSWMLYRGKDKKGLKTDSTTAQALVTALVQPRQVKDFPTKGDAELGLKDPSVVVSLWVNGVKKPEKKEEKDDKKDKKEEKDKKDDKPKDDERPQLRSQTPDVELVFGRIDSDKRVAVRRRFGPELKESLVVQVEGNLLELAQANPLSYLDKSLPSFLAPNDLRNVNQVLIDLDGKTTQVRKKDAKDQSKGWVFDKPADLAGRKADAGAIDILVDGLNGLRVSRWQSLKPTDEELGKLGLKAPSGKLTVTWTADNKPKDVSLLLGKETDDKKGYYAKRSDLESVFVVDRTEVDRFKQPLLDLTVFNFSPGQVKTLTLKGWWRLGQAATLALERKGAGNWEVTNTKDTKIDPQRVEQLVATLQSLRAEKFDVLQGNPKPAHKLELKEGALEIELVLSDKEKTKLTLTLGAASDGGIYAISNQLAKDVFVIGKGADDILEKVKKDPEYLTGS